MLLQVEQHGFFEFCFAVVDRHGVVVPVEAVDEGLNGGLVEMAHIGSGLSRFLSHHHGLRANTPECVDDYFAAH